MKLNDFISRYRRWIIIIPIVITLLILIPLTKARINPDLMDYLPDDIEANLDLAQLEEVFGKYEPFLIIFEAEDVLSNETLERVYEINNELKFSMLVDDVMSLFETKYIRGEEGTMLVDPAVDYIPQTQEEREELRLQLMDNPLAYGLMVSDDFRYTAIIVNAEEGVTDEEFCPYIEQIVEQFPGPEKVFFNGLPYLRYEVQRKTTRDFMLLMPLGLIIMLVFLYFSFRERRGVLLPFAVVIMSIAIAMGLMPLLGYELSLIAILIPIMMIAIANNYGVHIVARYQELNATQPTWDMPQIVGESLRQLTMPIILTGLTTIFGIMGLLAHVLLPAKQMGLVSSVAIAFALMLSLLFISAVMLKMKKGKPIPLYTQQKQTTIDRILNWTSKVSVNSPRMVIAIFALFMVVAGLGISKLEVSVNLDRMMPKKHTMRQATKIADEKFGGTKIVSVLFDGEILDPEVMQAIDRVGVQIEQIEGVGNVTSIASVIRLVSKSLNDPDSEYYDVIPNSREAIAQYIEFYNMSGDPEDFEKLLDFDYTKAMLAVQFSAENMEEFSHVEFTIRSLIEEIPSATLIAGHCLVEKEISNAVVRGQVNSLIFALLTIAVLLWIIFRSVTAGFLGAIPLLVTLVCNFGLMGWLNLQLDIGNSLLSSIAIGIGVDYTIHLFWRLRYELSLGKEYSEAIITTLTTTGRGIAINALSVIIGFSVLLLSGMVIIKTFAFLIIFSLLLCLFSALILIPAIVQITQPKFLKKEGRQIGYE